MPPRAIYEHSGPAELVLEGDNLTPDTLKLYHNGVLYTPLESSDTYAYYLLGDNGTNKVMLNGKNFSTIIVKDIVVPEILPNSSTGYQMSTDAVTGEAENGINRLFVGGACINYPYEVEENYPYFLFKMYASELLMENDFNYFNCQKNNFGASSGTTRINVSVINTDRPGYITYQGFIIAVFNYSA